jgi:CBS domain containing-hemolysin-like protein
MTDLQRSLVEREPNPRTDHNLLPPDLAAGSRFRVKSRGKYSRCLEGRTGKVIGFAHTKNALRVLLDGQKHPQTLHRCYLEPIIDPAKATAAPDLGHMR